MMKGNIKEKRKSLCVKERKAWRENTVTLVHRENQDAQGFEILSREMMQSEAIFQKGKRRRSIQERLLNTVGLLTALKNWQSTEGKGEETPAFR